MSLMRRLVLGDLDLTDYPFSVEFGADMGSPENVYDVLVSLLSDGEISTSDRVSNRSLSFTVLVEGPTLTDLAVSEAALIAECDKPRNTLTVDPGDEGGGGTTAAIIDEFPSGSDQPTAVWNNGTGIGRVTPTGGATWTGFGAANWGLYNLGADPTGVAYKSSAVAAQVVVNAGVADATVTTGYKIATRNDSGLVVRFVDANNMIRVHETSGGLWAITKVVAGVATTVTSGGSNSTGTVYTLAVTCSGTSISLSVNGTPTLSATISEAALVSATKFGLLGGGTATNNEWQRFEIGVPTPTPVSVFDTFRVQATLQYDDDLEQANFRRYRLTIPASPYPRGEDLVVTAAAAYTPGTPAAETVVDNCSVVTGWTNLWPAGGSISSTAGAIVVPSATISGITAVSCRRTGTVNFATPATVVAVTYQTSATPTTPLAVSGFDAASYQLSLALVSIAGGWTTAFYTVPAGHTTTSRLDFSLQFSGSANLSIDKVSTWDRLPDTGTARQKAMSLVPGGSVRTQGSIHVTHATNALGKTIVYTHPSGTGYLPPLRPWRTQSETVTTDTSLVSGARHRIGPTTFTRYSIPVAVLPTGRVEVWARFRAVTSVAVPGIIRWAVTSKMGSTDLSYELHYTTYTFAALNTWYLIPLGSATMPPVDLGPAGIVAVDLHEIDTSLGIEVDEAYLFATDHGSLTVVDCGTSTAAAGGPSRHLWIDAPSLTQPMGAVFRGHSANRSDAFHAGPDALPWGKHDFDPAGTNVFVATANATDAETSLEHYRRWHTHNGDA